MSDAAASDPPFAASSVASTDVLSERAAGLIHWLRDYANHRLDLFTADERRCVPPYVVLDFGNQGLLGLQVDRRYGGLGLSHRDTMAVVQQLAAIDLSLAMLVGIHNVLGVRPIANHATESLKNQLLPVLATGRGLAAFALTEPGAGSNPRALAAVAESTGDGGWALTGTKIWIGNASWAHSTNVFAKLRGKVGSDSVTAFTLLQGDRGLTQGPEALTMGVRSIVQNTVCLDAVRVTPERMLGQPGQGMEVANDAMLYARLGIASISIGAMKRCCQIMLSYASERTVGTGRLLQHPVTLQRISSAVASIEVTEKLVAFITERLDAGRPVAPDLLIACKTSAPELLWRCVDDTMQMLGGRGYIETNHVARLFRDARLLRIFEGPTETLLTYLGMRLLTGAGDIAGVLHADFQAHALADRVQESVAKLKAECAKAKGSPSSALQQAFPLAGQLATEALVHAASTIPGREASPETLAWLVQHQDATLSRVTGWRVNEPTQLTVSQLTDRIHAFSTSIGSISVRTEPT